MKLLKGDPVLNATVLTVAGVVGALTGVAIEALPTIEKVAIALGVGLTCGALLYVAITLVKRRRQD
jgi:hypothetical protein